MQPLAQVGPFLKWAGGKGRLLDQFRRFIPDSLAGRGYVEPFMGSAAVFFEVVQTRRPARCTLLDANPQLVNLFVHVRDNLDELLPKLAKHDAHHNAPNITEEARKLYYYAVRSTEPTGSSSDAAARFLYLNKTCFNGLHRLNRNGKFNVPMGGYARPTIFLADQLRAAAAVLKTVHIETASYDDCERFIADGDFVYFDPPYEPLSATSSFTAYAKSAFTQADQVALRDLLVRISGRCQWMASNSTADVIEKLYDEPGMFKHYVLAARSINSAKGGRGKIPELVVTNYQAQNSR